MCLRVYAHEFSCMCAQVFFCVYLRYIYTTYLKSPVTRILSPITICHRSLWLSVREIFSTSHIALREAEYCPSGDSLLQQVNRYKPSHLNSSFIELANHDLVCNSTTVLANTKLLIATHLNIQRSPNFCTPPPFVRWYKLIDLQNIRITPAIDEIHRSNILEQIQLRTKYQIELFQ